MFFRSTKFLLIVLLFLFTLSNAVASSAASNKGSIKGVVSDGEQDIPMEYVSIAIYSDTILVSGTITNSNGAFHIKDLKEGSYSLEANFIGYDVLVKKNITLEKKSRNIDLGKMILHASNIGIDAVEVVGQKKFIEYQLDKKVLNVSQHQGAAGGSVVNVLENVPSIDVDIEENVSVRGSRNFKVLIDGKPTSLNAQDALKQIPAEAAEKIEIITNPSAKYDPEGEAGIINIIMKKEYATGLNGIVNASFRTDPDFIAPQFNTNGVVNLRQDKVNYFLNFNHNNNGFRFLPEVNSTEYHEGYTRYTYSDLTGDGRFIGGYLRGGADFYLNDKNTFTVFGQYNPRYFYYRVNAEYLDRTGAEGEFTDEYFLNKQDSKERGDYYYFGFNDQHKFDNKGHELLLQVNYNFNNPERSDEQLEYFSDINFTPGDINPEGTNTNRNRITNYDHFETRLDYTKPFSEENKLEAGFEYEYQLQNVDFKEDTFDIANNEWTNNLENSYLIDYTRSIYSVYGTYSHKLFGTSFLLGLRGEYTDRVMLSDYKYQKMDFFPSLHISREFPSETQIQASYSKRIRRPGYGTLNPLSFYSDRQTVFKGNPEIDPAITHSFELNFQQTYEKQTISLETYYRNTSNVWRYMSKGSDEGGKTIRQPENLDREYRYGAELSADITFAKWWKFYPSVYGALFNLNGNENGENKSVDGYEMGFEANSTFTLPGNTRLQLRGYYDAKETLFLGEVLPQWAVNVSVRKEFLDRKLSATFNIRDVFGSQRYRTVESGSTSTYTYETRNTFRGLTPVYSVTFSYKLNNYKSRNDINIGGGGGGGIF